MGKLKTWEADEKNYQKFKILMAKEGIGVGDKINEFIAEYIKVHGDGNPAYSLDLFIKNAEARATPAVFRSKQDWLTWLENCTDEKIVQDILSQTQLILGLADNRILALRGHTVI